MPEVHALLSASSSKQWLNCPPSARLQENFPNESSVYAEEGTFAHSICEYKVKKYLHERVRRPQSEEFYTEELEQSTDAYYEFVVGVIEEMKQNGCEPLVLVEERVDYSHIAPSGFGTADMQGTGYLWVFCLVYLLSKLKIDDMTMLCTGLIYGGLGFAFLFIFDYGTALNGWNTNSIAMIGCHSFLIFLVPFFREQRMRNKFLLIIAAWIFSILVSPTDSRSGALFALVGALFAIGLLPRSVVSKNHFRTSICLILPLIISVIVISVSNSTIMEGLNIWSYQKFHKPIFNGRDELWKYGFELLWQNPLIGTGNLNAANWHNSAITCLVATGILGYIFWIMAFGKIMVRAREFLDDYIVIGCFVSFIILYVQQSVELGFISGNPTLLGYIMLGLMLGRVRFLEELEDDEAYESQYNCTDI